MHFGILLMITLDFCAERNEKPDKPFAGKFVVESQEKVI